MKRSFKSLLVVMVGMLSGAIPVALGVWLFDGLEDMQQTQEHHLTDVRSGVMVVSGRGDEVVTHTRQLIEQELCHVDAWPFVISVDELKRVREQVLAFYQLQDGTLPVPVGKWLRDHDVKYDNVDDAIRVSLHKLEMTDGLAKSTKRLCNLDSRVVRVSRVTGRVYGPGAQCLGEVEMPVGRDLAPLESAEVDFVFSNLGEVALKDLDLLVSVYGRFDE